MAKYTDAQKAQMYASVAEKLALAAGELQKFAGQPSRSATESTDEDVLDAHNAINTLSNMSGKYAVNAKALAQENADAE